ncbi:MAG: hypothetical protein FWE88_04825, partial [Phycisphaerae bacterium]|nr:hypothetical protein [Phycisphaerae bacterium]
MDEAYQLQQKGNKKSGWACGDFNYDGKIDAKDYALIDAALVRQSGLEAAQKYIDAHTAMFGEAYTTALKGLIGSNEPEPTPEPAR